MPMLSNSKFARIAPLDSLVQIKDYQSAPIAQADNMPARRSLLPAWIASLDWCNRTQGTLSA
jgi:hypothetical protein